MTEEERREHMSDQVDRASFVVKEVAGEWGLPLMEDKKERLILHSPIECRGRQGMAEKVNWLGVILDEELDFDPHWENKIAKVRSLLVSLVGVGNSKCGMSPSVGDSRTWA